MVKQKPNILLITYYWPPAGGAGVQRWLKMCKYLAESYNITVFHPSNADYPIIDESLLNEIPENIKSISNEIWEPYSLAKKLSPKNKNYQKGNLEAKEKKSVISQMSLWVRANVFIPDARMHWIQPSIKKLKTYLENNVIDVIISTGPPHSTHLIALGLKKRFPNLTWLADFRDPWTQIDYFHQLPFTQSSIEKHQKLEKEVLQNATIVTTVSPTWAKELEHLGADKVHVIYNGFDEEDFSFYSSISKEVSIPEISYIGSLNEDRNPTFLWKSLDKYLNQYPERTFKLKFIGTISNQTQQEILKFDKLSNQTVFLNYMSHREVLEHTQKASILLLLMNDTPNINGIIPGKFFEYLATGNPILCVGKKDTDLDLLLQETKSGEMINFGDEKAVDLFLNAFFNQDFQPKSKSENQYTRGAAAKNIENLINLHL